MSLLMSLLGVAVGMAVIVMIVVMMIMAAVRAVRMRLGAVPMSAMVMMGMIVVVMIVRAVIMIMIVVVVIAMIMPVNRRGRDIGAAFRIERCLDLDNRRPEAARHILNDMITPDAQALLQEFGRQVTIAEMPGDARQRGGVGAADLREAFGSGDDFDDASVLQRQAVAGAQHHRLGQIEQEGEAAHAGHRDAAAITIFIVEDDRVGGFAGPRAGGTNGMSVLHGLARVQKTARAGRPARRGSLPYAPWAG
jgi:hypothetical protein